MGRHKEDNHRSDAKNPPGESSAAVSTLLSEIAVGLRYIYAVGTATELALRKQNAERDVELADSLRVGVCNPAWDLAEKSQVRYRFASKNQPGETVSRWTRSAMTSRGHSGQHSETLATESE